jgi:hypothetical protein
VLVFYNGINTSQIFSKSKAISQKFYKFLFDKSVHLAYPIIIHSFIIFYVTSIYHRRIYLMRKNFMLFVVGLVCLFVPSLTVFGISAFKDAKFGADCKTLSVTMDSWSYDDTVTAKVGGVSYGSTYIPFYTTAYTINLSQEFFGTTTFVISGANIGTHTKTLTCTKTAPAAPVFTPPATQDGRVNVYAPTNVAVYESITNDGCALVINALDAQGVTHDMMITQAMRDAVSMGLIAGDEYAQFYKLSDGTFQLNVGPYNNAGDVYVLNIDNCPSTSMTDKNSTYRNGEE